MGFVVIVPVSKDKTRVVGSAEVVTRGFIYVKENLSFLGRSKDVVNKVLDKETQIGDWNALKNRIEKKLDKFFLEEIGRKPVLLVTMITV
jgi:ribonuclease J